MSAPQLADEHMKEIATIEFVDTETNDPGVAIVRASANEVGLALSLRSNGDLQVFLSKRDCELLVCALQKAVLRQVAK